MTAPPPIPFHVVTGFLGAGKTTLINRLLRAPDLADALVMVNEWGESGSTTCSTSASPATSFSSTAAASAARSAAI